MMKRLFLALLLTVAGFHLIAQNTAEIEWAKTYGGTQGDVANAVVATNDGGYAVVGYTNSKGEGRSDLWLLKLDKDGNKVWEKTYGGTKYDVGKSILATADGGFMITGDTKSKGAGNLDLWVLKVNKDGELLWDKTLGDRDYDFSASFVSLTKAADNGYVVTGHSRSKVTKDYDVLVVKMDENGEILWKKTHGKEDNDFASSIITTPKGGFLIAGNTKSKEQGVYKFWLMHLDNKGMLIEEHVLPDGDIANSIAQGPDGGFVVAGNTRTGGGESNIWVMLLDKALQPVWHKVISAYMYDYANSVITTFDDGIVVTGFSLNKKGEKNYDWVSYKFNRLGQMVWEKRFGGAGDDRPNMIIPAENGKYVAAGYTKSEGAGMDDVHVIKFSGYLFDLEKCITDARMDTLDYLLKPKGEFEENKDYAARVSAYESLKLMAIAAEQQKFDERQFKEISESYSPIKAEIEELSYYNADVEAYRVLIADQWYELPMDIATAKEFKNQWKKAIVHGYTRLAPNLTTKQLVNLGFFEPTSNKPFAIGEQVKTSSDATYKTYVEAHKLDSIRPEATEIKGTGKNIVGCPYPTPVGVTDAKWFEEVATFEKLGIGDCMKGKMAEHKSLLSAKDEFEKTNAYEKRLVTYDANRAKALAECQTDVEFAKQEKIKSSYKFVTFNISEISSYNAEKSQFQILVNKKWYAMPISKDDAQSFKDNFSNIEVKGTSRLNPDNIKETEVINLKVLHTSANKVIPVGKQVDPKDDKFLNNFMKSTAQ